ncbi:MAG: threonyl-tRNA synthetase editing domain-containing protein, partial [Candidatus Odinarchaeia archaeon]
TIEDITGKLKSYNIILIPFAHLFGKPANPECAIKTLKAIQQILIKKGFNTKRLPFGWFNKLDIKMKGHPLSRISRKING